MRSREILYTTLFFAVSCVLVFAFGFVREGRPLGDAAAGILWIAIAFSGTLALGRAFERERQSETLRALLMAPVDRPALYVGKLVGVLLLLAAVEVVVVPLVALMFQAPLFAHPLLMVGLLAAGTLGFAAVGTLFAAMLVRARSRDVLLPMLLYPITIPVIIAGVRGTAALLQPEADLPMARALAVDAGVLRRRLRHARAVDVRAGDDGVAMTDAIAETDEETDVEPTALPAVDPRGGDVRLRAVHDHRGAVRIDDGAGAEDLLLPRAVVDRRCSRSAFVCGIASALRALHGEQGRRPARRRGRGADGRSSG